MVLVWLILTCCSNKDKNALWIGRDSCLLPLNSEIVSDGSSILNHPVPFYIRYKIVTAVAIAVFFLVAVIVIFFIRNILRRKRVVRDFMIQRRMAEYYLNMAGVILVALDDQARIIMKFQTKPE